MCIRRTLITHSLPNRGTLAAQLIDNDYDTDCAVSVHWAQFETSILGPKSNKRRQ